MMTSMALDARTPMVGRDTELVELVHLVGVETGTGGAVLLAGDAGVGKTRLLRALRERAAAAGSRDVVGHCLDFGDSALPYLPFTEIFGRLLADLPGEVGPLVAAHPAIDRLLPGRRVRTSTPARGIDPEPVSGERAHWAQSSRAALFESVHALFEALGAQNPLLVVVEDAHWADQATRDLIAFLVTRRFTSPVSLVVSYRSDDLHRRHPLRAAIAEWARLPGVHRLQLGRLGDMDVSTLVRSLQSGTVPEHEVQTIVARAEGNAFFAEELVSAAQMSAWALPEDLADLLLVRLDRLDDATRTVVRSAAVGGRLVSHRLLAQIMGMTAPALDLERALRDAVESHVLVPSRSDSYAFRHALLAEAVYDDLLPGERVRLHAAYVSALQSEDGSGTAAELARHARAAQDMSTAITASIAAGDDAMTVGAPDEAARHYQLALELLSADDRWVTASLSAREAHHAPRGAGRTDPGASTADPRGSGAHLVVELVLQTAEALVAAGDPHRAVKLIADHLDTPPTGADPSGRGQLLVGLAAATFLTDSPVDLLTLTGEAMAIVPDSPSPLRAQVLTVHAKAVTYRLGGEEGARFALEAHDMARALGLPRVAADAAMTLAWIDAVTGDDRTARGRLEAVLTHARADGDVNAELHGLHQMGELHYRRGEFAEALRAYRGANLRARQTGRPWAPYALDARALAGITAYTVGDWEAALEAADVSGQSPPPGAEALLSGVRLGVLAGRGDPGAAELIAATRPWWEREGMTAVLSGAAAIDVDGDHHDVASVVRTHDEVVDLLHRLWQQSTVWVQIRLSALVLGQLAGNAAGTAQSALGELGRSGARFVAAAAAVWESHPMDGPTKVEARAWRSRVIAEDLRLRWLTGVDAPGEGELVAAWRDCVSAFDEFGHAFETARSRARLASVLKATGHAEEVRALVDAARETAQRLGAEPLLAELRTLGGAPRRPPGAESVTAEAVLTGREHEILALVAQGRSNGEIGRQLFISPKTVSVHVSNLMAKLGASGRTEAVALARRSGLLEG